MLFKNFHQRSIALLAVLVLLVSCFFESTVAAQDPDQPILLSRVFGLARDQSVLLTVSMPDGPSGISHVKIFDSTGVPVAESAEVRISGGTFHSFHFEPDDIHLVSEEGTGRRQLRASCWIRVGGPWASRASATLEIIDSSTGITDGASNTFLNGEHPPTPQLDPLGNFSFGIVPGQSVMFSVFNPEETTVGTPKGISWTTTLVDTNGNPVARRGRELQIAPASFGSVSFDYSDLAMAPETRTGRKQFKPLFAFVVVDFPSPSVQPFFSPGTLLVTGEVVDNNTGKTVVEQHVVVYTQRVL
jgi:hypothetical protein